MGARVFSELEQDGFGGWIWRMTKDDDGGWVVNGELNGVNLEGKMVFESQSQGLEVARRPTPPQGTDICWDTKDIAEGLLKGCSEESDLS